VFVREDSGSIAVLRLAHGKVSALDADFCDALTAEIGAIGDGAPRALVITGTGSAFSAGVDLFKVLDGGAAYLDRFLPAMKRFFHALLTFPKPAVAAVNGHAIAGGCIIAAACDHRVMAIGTGRIGVPELSVGVPFPMLPFAIVGARVAPSAFRQLVFTGRTVTAEEAVTLGLADEAIAPEGLLERACEHAGRLCTIPPMTFALTKRTFNTSILERVHSESALNAEAQQAWAHPDVLARVRAYLDQTVRKKGQATAASTGEPT
jgi:enoyl-CoA hydratase